MVGEPRFYSETTKHFLLFALLLFYSLIPAFAKVTNSDKFYLLSPLLLIILLLGGKKEYNKFDIFFLLFFSFVVLYFPISYLVVPDFDKNAGLYGVINYMIPMLGYFISRNLKMETFFDVVKKVGIIHGIYAFLTYGFIKLPENVMNAVFKIREGAMAYRMCSFNGSFAFSSLMLLTFIIIFFEIFEKRIKFKATFIIFLFVGICLFLSFQRNAWLATIATILFFLIMQKGKFIRKHYLLLSIFLLIFLCYISFSKINLYFIQQRFQIFKIRMSYDFEPFTRFFNAFNAGINNFTKIPTGVGLGQVGQGFRFRSAITNMYYSIPDGDYFRILSETGIFGLFFYSSFLAIFLRILINIRKIDFDKPFLLLVVLLFALHLQMIFSNVTEFYFVNLIYWILIGLFFSKIKDFFMKRIKTE